MEDIGSYLRIYKQNHQLPILLAAPDFGYLPPDVIAKYGLTHRKTHYFFIFMIDGTTSHGVDLQQYNVHNNELLFILPHQIHQLPASKQGTDYFKLGFDDECLSLLPKQYPFLINPLNKQKLVFTPAAANRLKAIFSLLREVLRDRNTDPELVLAHLNSLLTEINATYFATDKEPAGYKLSTYVKFKVFVEENLTSQPSIQQIAEKLALNTNSLYNIVKHYSGHSPKEYITNRLILEAKRRLYYAESTSIKELAYELGFNDPEYFARLFKKVTSTTISSFVQYLSGSE